MGVHLIPIKAAMITFPLIAALLTIPFLIYNYHRYGYINKFRVLLTYSFALFMLTAFYLVILPLPETRNTCSGIAPGTKYYTLEPFTFVRDFLKETQVVGSDPATYLRAVHERAFQQAVFNFILLLPLGVYIRYYFRQKWYAALAAGLLVSLFFEWTQLTGLYGIYACPYRIFDADDLLLNTCGAVAGFFLAPVLLLLFPPKEQLDHHFDWETQPVGYIHRMLAFVLDWSLVAAGTRLAVTLQHIRLDSVKGLLQFPLTTLAVFAAYFIVLPYVTNGRTFGLWLLRLRIAGIGPRLSLKAITLRSSSLFFGYGGISFIFLSSASANTSPQRYVLIAWTVCFAAIQLVFAAHFVWMILRRKRLFFYELLSETHIERISIPKPRLEPGDKKRT